MSLLIKALEKAEKGKTAEGSSELSLEPLAKPAEAWSDDAQRQMSRQAAATVFAAKNEQKKRQPSNKGLWIGAAALLLLVVIGMQFYAYFNSLSQPDVVMARSPVAPVASAQPPASQSLSNQSTAPQQTADEDNKTAGATDLAAGNASSSPNTGAHAQQQREQVLASTEPVAKLKESSQLFNEPSVVNQAVSTKQTSRLAQSQQLTFGESLQMDHEAVVKITRNQPTMGVNPNLLAAYQAFNAGDDATAQHNYRQVLQGDIRNVDALLGMAAIAFRQGRNNDAAGWYGKVLEVEPRNSVAQAAMISALVQTDPVSSESRIKNLLAQQPEAAHLYAALGNLYAQ
ncbi:MAG: hypothetical protein ABI475_10245, partial [Methylophilaceae bacterium]